MDSTWKQQNDPVMGGASSGKWSQSADYGTMEGTCAIIPRLKVPGFIKAVTSGTYADVSSCTGIELEVRSDVEYAGYRFNFGSDKSSCGKFFARGYKADFPAPVGSFGKVQIPFNKFTNCWDDGSGDAVMLPPSALTAAPTLNIVELAQSVDSLSTLVAAVVAGDLVTTLTSPGPFTVFAPTNDAFGALPAGVLDSLLKPENKNTLVDILTFHVLSGQVLSTDLAASQEVATVEGKMIKITADASGVKVGANLEATVVAADNLATNGVAHIIDAVMLPPSALTAAPTLQPTMPSAPCQRELLTPC